MPNRFVRLGSILFDHLVMIIVMFPFMIIGTLLLIGITELLEVQHNLLVIILLAPFYLYLNKDFYRGKSLAKRVLGFQVVAVRTGQPASEVQCFLRNLTFFIWPIEVFISLISPKRRMGDILAHTKVIQVSSEPVPQVWKDIKQTRWKNSYFIIILLGLIYDYIIFNVMTLLME